MPGVTFDIWMRDVNAIITSNIGLSTDDLSDRMYRDAYDDGADPDEYAGEILEEMGFFS